MATRFLRLALTFCAVVPLVSCVYPRVTTPDPTSRPTVGAIRWDGWFADNPWQKNLDDAQWRYRLPFFAEVSKDGRVVVCEDSQEVMDREIGYAADAGLDYWAFCYYHPKSWNQSDAYNYGWRRYLASSQKSRLNFCLLLQGGQHLGPANEWPQTVQQFVTLFREPSYQRVSGGRPLLYVFSCENLVPHFGSAQAARAALDLLRAESVNAGTANPYIVAQIWLHQTKESYLRDVGFDAVSAYSAQGGDAQPHPYADLAASNLRYWNQFRETGLNVVPLVNAGWDGRPRAYKGAWYAEATPREIADDLGNAFTWLRQNRTITPADTVLIYAWNEFDEGGWLCPTREAGTARLDALRKLLRTHPPSHSVAR